MRPGRGAGRHFEASARAADAMARPKAQLPPLDSGPLPLRGFRCGGGGHGGSCGPAKAPARTRAPLRATLRPTPPPPIRTEPPRDAARRQLIDLIDSVRRRLRQRSRAKLAVLAAAVLHVRRPTASATRFTTTAPS